MREIIDGYETIVATRARASAATSLYREGQIARARFAAGMGGLYREGRAARYEADTIIGGPLYHTVGDREAAIKQLGTEFAQLENDLARNLGWTDSKPTMDETNPKYGWWRSNAMPTLNEWQAFQTANLGSWLERFSTNWDVIVSWQDRLKSLREAADKAGFSLASPAPQPLPTTLPEGALSGLAGLVASIMSLLRVIIYTGLAIAGGFGLYELFKAARSLAA